MADTQKYGPTERDIEQAITALKKGSYLLKYGRRGKPKFCPFQLSSDETTLIWYSGKDERHVKLSDVSKIIPGQRTAIFQRYPRPEKEYQSFSLICTDRSLDLICKDKDEAETWFVGLKALIGNGSYSYKWRVETRDSLSSESPRFRNRKSSSSPIPIDPVRGYGQEIRLENSADNRLGKAFSDLISYTAVTAQPKSPPQADPGSSPFSPLSAGSVDNANGRISTTSETVRVSLSSAVSSSSQGSFHEDFDALGDAFIWGEGAGDGLLGGGFCRFGSTSNKMDALLPKALESTTVLDINQIACGSRHAVLVTKQGAIYSWGEESGGRLGHGVATDVPQPKLINMLSGMNTELVACGEYHTCAVTASGDLFTWGDGTYNSGLLGHGSDVSYWIPKKVSGDLEGLQVSYISCGPWHTAIVTLIGKLFTFGDGTFGALGHGDRTSIFAPREVEALSEYRAIRVACGVWHTVAVVEPIIEPSSPDASTNSLPAKLFTWGVGDKGCLGHGDTEPVLVPKCVDALADENISQVACGNDLTVILTAAGEVYTTGCNTYGQLGNPKADSKIPSLVGDSIADSSVEAIACGSFHVAILTSKADVYTWGKNTNGQLGHGDNKDRSKPVRVDFLKDKQVKAVACGSNFTAIICPHRWVSSADHLTCSGCRNPFGFRRKRHNCYNCGLVFCKACSSRKAMKASLAPTTNKPYRVCDDCFIKLRKVNESALGGRIPRGKTPSKKHNDAVEEPLGRRLMKQLSKISSSESIPQVESVQNKSDKRTELDSSSVFPALNGILQAGSSCSPKLSTSIDWAKVRPLPSPKRLVSSPTSYLGQVSPPRSPERAALDYSKHMNGSLNAEIMSLKAQVEGLTSETRKLKAELKKKSKQLDEVTARAVNEAEKCKSANEVIQSLTAQLTAISERLQGNINTKENSKAPTTNNIAGVSNSASVTSYEVESNYHQLDHGDHQTLSYNSQNQLEKGHSPRQLEKGQRIVHAESGVYLTLCSLPDGGNELKRVRFSRKRFTEQEAERWWAENGTRICQLHNIQNAE